MRTATSLSILATLLALVSAQDDTTSLSPDESLVSILSTEGAGISDLLSSATDFSILPVATSTTTTDDDDAEGTGSVITNPTQPSPTGIVPGNGTTSGVAGTGTGGSGSQVTLTSTPDASDVTATQTETSTAGGIVETGSPDDSEGGAGSDDAQQSGDTQSEGSAAATGVPVLLGALGLMGALAL